MSLLFTVNSRLFIDVRQINIRTSALAVGPEKLKAIFWEEADFAIDFTPRGQMRISIIGRQRELQQ
jgi:hypothetical protein